VKDRKLELGRFALARGLWDISATLTGIGFIHSRVSGTQVGVA
jgi:hypothetical protein